MTGMSTRQVAAATGAAYYTLDRWVRGGVVGPQGRGSGSRRRWSLTDAVTVRVLVVLNKILDGGNAGGEAVGGIAWRHETLAAAARAFETVGHPRYGYLAVTRTEATYETGLLALASVLVDGPAVVIDVAAALASSDLPPVPPGPRSGDASGAAQTVPIPSGAGVAPAVPADRGPTFEAVGL